MTPSLPRFMLITSRKRMKPDFAAALEAALQGGARLIQLREPDLTPLQRRELAAIAKRLCDQYGATMIINRDAALGRATGAGAHWPERTLNESCDWLRDYLGTHWRNWVRPTGASVHNVGVAQWAQFWPFDYLVFGHVFATPSHVGEAPRGLDALREVCQCVSLPVYAVGGVDARNAGACLEAGAHGIAVISAVWDAPDVGGAVQELIAALT